MAERIVDIVYSAKDDFTATLKRYNAATAEAEAVTRQTGGAFDKLTGAVTGMAAAYLSLAGAKAVISFLLSSVQAALEAEIAWNKLRIQVNNLGLDYRAVEGEIRKAVIATSRYAIVQNEQVAAVLQKLIFTSGDYQKSLKSLNLAYDLAYLKGIDVSESAFIIGKSLTGNIESLGRLFPELKGVTEEWGKYVTETEKAALATTFLSEKVGGATEKMTDHEREIARARKTWEDIKKTIDETVLKEIQGAIDAFGLLNDKLRSIAETQIKMGWIGGEMGAAVEDLTIQTEELTNAVVKQEKAVKSRYEIELENIKKLAKEREEKEKKDEAAAKEAAIDRQIALEKEYKAVLEINIASIGDLILGPFRTLKPEKIRLMAIETGIFAGEAYRQGIELALDLDTMPKEWAGNMFFFPPAEEQEAAFSLLEIFSQRRIALAEHEFITLSNYAQLHSMAEMARANIVAVSYRSMEDAVLQLLETGRFSVGALAKSILGQIKIELIGIAVRAGVNAVYQYAKALAAFAEFNPMAVIHMESARTFARTAAMAGAGAAGVQLIGGAFGVGRAERPAPGTPGGTPISAIGTSRTTQPTQTQNITINIYNPLSTQNWAEIIEDNIIPALNDAADRNINIVVATA